MEVLWTCKKEMYRNGQNLRGNWSRCLKQSKAVTKTEKHRRINKGLITITDY